MPARIVLRLSEGGAAEEFPAAVREALRALEGDGTTEEELAGRFVNAAGRTALPLLFYAMATLAGRGLVSYWAMAERPIASASGNSPLIHIRRPQLDSGTRYAFSRAALMRRHGDRMVLETARSAVQITIHDPRVLPVLAGLGTPSVLSGLDEEMRVFATLLLSCGMLDENGREDAGPLSHWEFPDLLLHARSRVGRHIGGYGGTYACRDRFPPPPATKPPMSADGFELFRPDLERLESDDVPFTCVIERRCSTRRFGERPIGIEQLGEFLYRVARQRSVSEDESGQDLGSRPYPGGGAIYELEIYVAAGSCRDLSRGLYQYDPLGHRLFRLQTPDEAVETILWNARASSGSVNPQVVLTIAARFDRLFWKYESMRYATILKNVGVLFQTMYLVAEAMDLGACALGGGDSDQLSEIAGLDYYAESAVGEFMIGSRS